MKKLMAVLITAALGATSIGCASDAALAKDQAAFRKVKLSGGTVDIAKDEGQVHLLDDERVVCKRYRPTGSNLTQTKCQTVREKTREDESNQREMRKLVKSPPHASGTLTR